MHKSDLSFSVVCRCKPGATPAFYPASAIGSFAAALPIYVCVQGTPLNTYTGA